MLQQTVRSLLVVLVYSAAGSAPVAAGTVIRVGPAGDDAQDGSTWALAKATIQAGVTAADTSGGGEVWVQAGTYVETVDLPAGVHLYGGFAGTETLRDERDWEANITILDGQNAVDSVIRINQGNPTTVSGFTIQNAKVEEAAIWISYASPTISHNVLRNNIGLASGAGISMDHSDSIVTGNIFRQNHSSWDGAGIYSWRDSYPQIVGNTFEENRAFHGGAIAITGGGSYVAFNRFDRNRGLGSGIYVDNSSSTIELNLFTRNAHYAVYVWSSGADLSTTIAYNTIVGNSHRTEYSEYSAVFIPYSTNPMYIVGNLITHNGGGIRVGTYVDLQVHDNCVSSNNARDYVGIPDMGSLHGNVSLNPQLLADPTSGADGLWGTDDDEPGDPRLQAGSPCINAGDDSYVSVTTDFDGLARHVGCFVDIGAFEHQTVVPLPADFDDDCAISLADYDVFELCLYASGPGVEPPFDECLAVFDLDRDTDIDLADFAAFARIFDGA